MRRAVRLLWHVGHGSRRVVSQCFQLSTKMKTHQMMMSSSLILDWFDDEFVELQTTRQCSLLRHPLAAVFAFAQASLEKRELQKEKKKQRHKG